MTVLSSPQWGGDNNSYPLLVGAWDIGEIEVKLARPIYEVSVGVDGQLSIGETAAPMKNSKGDPSQYCFGSFRVAANNHADSGWIFFRLGTHPMLSHANVTIKAISSPIAASQSNQTLTTGKPAKMKKAKKLFEANQIEGRKTIAWIDLDNDGVNDLAVWDDGGAGLDLDYHRQRLIFTNVMGQWYLLDTDDVHSCGC